MKRNIIEIFETNWSTKPKYDDKSNSKKSLHIWEDGSSGVQVGHIEQVIV
jgi:hypothetical protein